MAFFTKGLTGDDRHSSIPYMQVNELTKLTNRHLAKLLDQLDEIQSPAIIKDAVKKHIWLFSHDVKDQIITKQVNEKEQVNEGYGR